MVTFDDGRNVRPPSRDQLAFPDFYAEHDAEIACQMVNMVHAAGGAPPSQTAVAEEARLRARYGSAPVRSRTTAA